MRIPKRVEIAGYCCWVIGILFLILALLRNFHMQDPIYIFSVGLAAFGIGTGFIGLSVARESGERMKEMAKIEEELNTKIEMLMDKRKKTKKRKKPLIS